MGSSPTSHANPQLRYIYLAAEARQPMNQPSRGPHRVQAIMGITAQLPIHHSITDDVERNDQNLMRHRHRRMLHPAPVGAVRRRPCILNQRPPQVAIAFPHPSASPLARALLVARI